MPNHTRLEISAVANGTYGYRFLGEWSGATAATRLRAEKRAREAAEHHARLNPGDLTLLQFVARLLHAEPLAWSEEVRPDPTAPSAQED